MTEPTLPLPRARATDPDTSWAAARDAMLRAANNRALAYRELVAVGLDGLTDFELADRTGLAQTSIGKRRGELRDMGLVVDSGRRRPAPSGSAAIVWVATPRPSERVASQPGPHPMTRPPRLGARAQGAATSTA